MTEQDLMLLKISIQMVFEKLPPFDRDLVALCSAVEVPEDYVGPWPPTLAAVGVYIGNKYKGRPFSEGAIRARKKKLFLALQAQFGGIE